MKLISMDSTSRQDLMLIFSKEDKYLKDLHGFLSSRRPKLKYEKKKIKKSQLGSAPCHVRPATSYH